MARMFADLHCHPTLYGFNRARNSDAEDDPERFTPWHVPPSNARAMADGRRAATYSQIDVAKMARAKVRLCFTSITPIEVGFFRGALAPEDNTSFVTEALALATGATALRSAAELVARGPRAALHRATAILRNNGPLRVLLQRAVMRYSRARIVHMASGACDYWDEFMRELAYLRAADGVRGQADVHILQDGKELVEPSSGTYHLIRDLDHLGRVMEGPDEEMAMVLTIEGGHTFTIGPDQERVADEVLFERIEVLRALPERIFFVTLAHHFDNGVCGHAHSIPDAGGLVMDQSRRMHAGLERDGDLGARVIRSMLALDEDLRDTGERRILLDVKHMSPLSRRQFYREILAPANEHLGGPDARPRIPVIMSHGAYSGVRTLDELIADAAHEGDHWHLGPFNAWGINACDEDIQAIHATGGLLGLVLDQRIMGLRPGDKTPSAHLPEVAFNQLLAMADVILQDERLDEAQRAGVWDCLCLGTDYDGFIDPLSCYPTALSLPALAEDLRVRLARIAHTRQIGRIGVDELVEKICWKNALEFTRRHLI